MKRLSTHQRSLLGLYLALVTLASGLPILLGFFTPLWIAHYGTPRPGVLPWSPLLTIIFVLLVLALGEISDRIVLRVFNTAHKLPVHILQALMTFIVMLACYRLVMTTYEAAVIAALTAVLGYLLLAPLINHLYKKAPKD